MTVTMRFNTTQLDDSPLRRFQWTRAAVRWLDDVGPTVRTALKNASPVGKGPRAGRMRDSIRYQRVVQPSSGVRGEFTANTPYATYVIKGTRAHRITAKAARTLRWQSGGQTHFARSVMHPGTKPNHFVETTMQAQLPHVQQRFSAIMREELGQ